MQIRLEVDSLRFLLDRDPDLGRLTIADTLSFLQKVNNSQLADGRRPGRLMVTAAIVYDLCYPLLNTHQKIYSRRRRPQLVHADGLSVGRQLLSRWLHPRLAGAGDPGHVQQG